MGNFRNVSIIDFLLPGKGPAEERGEAITTSISIRNPSLFAVSIGVLQMNLEIAGTGEALGALHGSMSLAPGDNKLEMSGKLLPSVDTSERVSDGVSRFFSSYLRGESSNVAVTITATEHSSCVWMQKALVGLKISTVFPGVAPGFQLISGINMTRLDVTMVEDDAASRLPGLPRWTNTKMLIRTSMNAEVKMPSSIQIPLDITNLSIALTMKDEKRQTLGSLVSSREACEFNQTDGGSFRLNMSRFYPITFSSDDEITRMANFVEDLLTKKAGIVMRLASDVKAHQGAFPYVETRMGMLSLQNIPIEGAPVIPGMNSFRDPPVRILAVDIERGVESSMTLKMTFSITNPSVVQTTLGALRFNVLFENARMGVAEIEDFSLKCCGEETVLSGRFEFKPATRDVPTAQRFLSNFVSGYFTDGEPQKVCVCDMCAVDLLDTAFDD